MKTSLIIAAVMFSLGLVASFVPLEVAWEYLIDQDFMGVLVVTGVVILCLSGFCVVAEVCRHREYKKLNPPVETYSKDIVCGHCEYSHIMEVPLGVSWCAYNDGKVHCYNCRAPIDLTKIEGCQESIDLFKKGAKPNENN